MRHTLPGDEQQEYHILNLFNIFIKDPGHVTSLILTRFPDVFKLRGTFDISKRRTVIQRELDEWANRNHTKFSKNKC